MSQGLDIYTILFAALALFLFFKLRSVLGTKTGDEVDYTKMQQPPQPQAETPIAASNVVPLSNFRWKGLCAEGSAVHKGLDLIASRDATFDAFAFLTGSKAAYEMFTTAFAKGDAASLKPHLSPEVFAGFESVIRERASLQHRQDYKFVGFDIAEIVDALIDEPNQEAEITVRYKAQAISSLFDKDNRLIEGGSDKVTDMVDRWTFAKKLNTNDPNWLLVGTQEE